ncbi:MAG: oxidoreductase C-terminal domain-containing protein [Ktedonobacteraceae bacterium]
MQQQFVIVGANLAGGTAAITLRDELIVRGRPDEYNVVAFYTQHSRILAAFAINRGRDILRAIPLIKAHVQVDAEKLRDENIDLRSLLPGARPVRTQRAVPNDVLTLYRLFLV